MRYILLIIASLIVACAAFATERIELTENVDDVAVFVEESNELRTVVRFEIGAFSREAVDLSGEVYYTLICGREAVLLNEKQPALPRICRRIIVPDDVGLRLNVLDAEYVDYPGMPVVPSKGNLMRSTAPAPENVPYEFGEVYNTAEWYPAELARIREPFIMRDIRGTVIELNAFQYHPARQTLRVYTSVTVEVVSDGPGTVNVIERSRRPRAGVPDFDGMYSDGLINYGEWGVERLVPVSEHGDMLIITYDAFHDAMLPLVDWKRQKGIPTTIMDISSIGNSSAVIKTFIRDFYDSTNLVFVLLVGDATQMATPFTSKGAADPTYALVDGNDGYPDILVGRFSAETVEQVETQVRRTLDYDKQPAGADWFHKGMGIASLGGPGHHGEYDYQHIGNIRDDLLAYGYTEVDRLYGSVSASQVAAALNSGRGIINYCGHGTATSWITTRFSNSNVDALTNGNMLPFIISVACINGQFAGRTCFAEAWLRATSGGEPSGAVATYMSSINQSWNPPMDAQDEVNDLLAAEKKTTFGGLCYNGACRMIEINGTAGEEMFNTWHIFGDPSLQVRTDDPATLAVAHEALVTTDVRAFDVIVYGRRNALCAVYHEGTLHGSAYTDLNGSASISLGEHLPVGEAVTLTVTAFNALPHVSTIQVISASGPYVMYDYRHIDDGGGNGNGLVENGESIVLGVGLVNVGPGDAADVEASISTLDGYVTITDGVESYGTISGGGGVGYSSSAFSFDVAGDVPDGHVVTFDLEVTDIAGETWYGKIDIRVNGPRLQIVSFRLDDALGNGNGVLDPGETGALVVTLANAGGGVAYSVAGSLLETDEHISLIDASGSFGEIDSSGGVADNAVDAFELVAGAACPLDHIASMELSVNASGGYRTSLYIKIPFGASPEGICGDINGGGEALIDISDLVYLVDYMFNEGPPPPVMSAANLDGRGGGLLDISDLIYLVNYMFHQGAAPVCDP
ncbi:MAG: hypothetical protein KAU35_06685 [candidate division Zixibacteria bacterium]|nr:hypothetical protein [candidate division Zixibacteria bacterium]